MSNWQIAVNCLVHCLMYSLHALISSVIAVITIQDYLCDSYEKFTQQMLPSKHISGHWVHASSSMHRLKGIWGLNVCFWLERFLTDWIDLAVSKLHPDKSWFELQVKVIHAPFPKETKDCSLGGKESKRSDCNISYSKCHGCLSLTSNEWTAFLIPKNFTSLVEAKWAFAWLKSIISDHWAILHCRWLDQTSTWQILSFAN